jgi:hypothetical protein
LFDLNQGIDSSQRDSDKMALKPYAEREYIDIIVCSGMNEDTADLYEDLLKLNQTHRLVDEMETKKRLFDRYAYHTE